jgi:general secretion pathway protein G
MMKCFLAAFLDYPTQQEGLAALVERPQVSGWNGPYVKSLPMDPWGRPYNYRIPGERHAYDLFTLGADNAPGGTGENEDVSN